jgi:hypothetical protein
MLRLYRLLKSSFRSLFLRFVGYPTVVGKLGKPRYIVTPGVIEVIIQEDWGKQAEFEWRARGDTFDDLPRA